MASFVGQVYDFSVVSGFCPGEDKADKTTHPYLSRTRAFLQLDDQAIFALCENFHWTQVVYIFKGNEAFRVHWETFSSLSLESYGIEITSFEGDPSQEQSAQLAEELSPIVTAQWSRVLVIRTDAAQYPAVLRKMREVSLSSPAYVWIVSWPVADVFVGHMQLGMFGIMSENSRDEAKIHSFQSRMLAEYKEWYNSNWNNYRADLGVPMDYNVSEWGHPSNFTFNCTSFFPGPGSCFWYDDIQGTMWDAAALLMSAVASLSDDELLSPTKVSAAVRNKPFAGLSGSFVLDAKGERAGFYAIWDAQESSSYKKLASWSLVTGFEFESTATFWGEATSVVDVFPPLTPEAPSVGNTTSTSAILFWQLPPAALRRYAPVLGWEIQLLHGSAEPTNYSAGDKLHLAVGSLVQGAIYTARLRFYTRGGLSEFSEAVAFTPLVDVVPCYATGCLEYAHCLPEDVECSCMHSYTEPVVPISSTRTCSLKYRPCTVLDPCQGPYSTCDSQSGLCVCEDGTELAKMDDRPEEEWRLCVPAVASTDQTRSFWAISLWLSAWGLLASVWVVWEFVFNAHLQHPYTMMQAFIAFAAPDMTLSLVNFVVYMEALVNGNPLANPSGVGGRSETECMLVACVMYVIVICTYCAPAMVGLFTFLTFNAISRGKASFAAAPYVVYGLCIWLPAIIGAALAATAAAGAGDDGAGLLGSYRGLYCYIRRWDSSLTGLVFVCTFVCSTAATVALYTLTALKIGQLANSTSGSQGWKAAGVVMKRGIFLTLTFVATWIWFVVTGGLAYSNKPVDIEVDMVGAIIINAQPIIDAFILLTMSNIREQYVARWAKQFGMTHAAQGVASASASSSTSSTSSFFGSSQTI